MPLHDDLLFKNVHPPLSQERTQGMWAGSVSCKLHTITTMTSCSGQQLCPLSLNNAILIPYPGSLLLRYLSALKQSSSSFEDIE